MQNSRLILLYVLAGFAGGAPARADAPLTQWETLQPNEEADNAGIAQELIRQLNSDYVTQNYRTFRDAHPRGIGCLAATFTVDPNLPAQYQIGVFAKPGQSYDAIIRFSSALGPQSDHIGDARGMAIKLIGVPGVKLLDDQPNALTQDFLQINAKGFTAVNTHDFYGIVKVKGNPALNLLPFLLESPITHALALKTLITGSLNNPSNGHSLAETQFYSQVPYLLKGGSINTPVKYSTRPCAPVAAGQLNGSSTELRDDLQDRLTNGSLCFKFALQFYVPDQGLNIEDGTSIWDESIAPFTDFATITVPQQTFRTDAKLHYCDMLSFQPWHALAEHQPLGNINRTRKNVYTTISTFRHNNNSENSYLPEPTSRSDFDALSDPTYSVWNAVKIPASAVSGSN